MRKRSSNRTLKALEKLDHTDGKIAMAKAKYSEAKHFAEREVWLSKTKFANISRYGRDISKLAEQSDRKNQEVVGEMSIQNDNGELALNDNEKMKAWIEHYDRLLNIEFNWPLALLEILPLEGPLPPVTTKFINRATEEKESR